MTNAKFALVLALLVTVGVAAWPSATQTSVVRGVTVAVTPGNLAADARLWDFAIAFDSRGARLDDEVMEAVVLSGDGRDLKPLAWEGAKAGATHRAGVLKFVPMQPRPKELELRITRKGEARQRVFRFSFGDWSA